MEYYSLIRKNKIMPLAATWMDLEIIIPSQKEKGKYHVISHVWNLKYDSNKLIYETETDFRHREQTCGFQGGGEMGKGGTGSLGLADANYDIQDG